MTSLTCLAIDADSCLGNHCSPLASYPPGPLCLSMWPFQTPLHSSWLSRGQKWKLQGLLRLKFRNHTASLLQHSISQSKSKQDAGSTQIQLHLWMGEVSKSHCQRASRMGESLRPSIETIYQAWRRTSLNILPPILKLSVMIISPFLPCKVWLVPPRS